MSQSKPKRANQFYHFIHRYGWGIPIALLAFLFGMTYAGTLNLFVATLLPLGTAVGTVWAAIAATRASVLTQENLEYQQSKDDDRSKPNLRVVKLRKGDEHSVQVLVANVGANTAFLVGAGVGSQEYLSSLYKGFDAILENGSFILVTLDDIGYAGSDEFGNRGSPCLFLMFYSGGSRSSLYRQVVPFDYKDKQLVFDLSNQYLHEYDEKKNWLTGKAFIELDEHFVNFYEHFGKRPE